jgi:hypothetical protein
VSCPLRYALSNFSRKMIKNILQLSNLGEEWELPNRVQSKCDCLQVLVVAHPVEVIELLKIEGKRVTAERFLFLNVVELFEVGKNKFT